ncbi:MAG: hypothetical protein BWY44_01173 [Candidatus Omnitrophica bacterium ADurb.Bin292]|jgi:hypothetical protein|nr:MAG: hypothetical protein BWY44_01173 [Candidatus Omnitrophica bacterium ADurb.Bin292]HOG24255.1 winged helix-turn-helix domain-containing protein [Candidatus Omnitrophota bacterium]HPW77213.1 winged helix-turn-helix domain-containing protein [Candidatus Omnitrophota bacterium]HQB12166.1 winged helix-turn-helix domain-containing protein [Candidatus Omnitrophota bacterium]
MQAQYYAIGETAGKIYRFLEQKGEQTVTKVQSEIGADTAIFFQAIGWLARENNINFNKLGKTLKISLINK